MYNSKSVGKVRNASICKEVEQKVQDCIALAKRTYRTELSVPIIKFDKTGCTAGVANSKYVNFNYGLLEQNKEDFINTTVPHEVAHFNAVNVWGISAGRGHGLAWKNVMKELGVAPRRCHSYDVSTVKRHKTMTYAELKCNCTTHLVTKKLAAKVSTGYTHVTCKKCKSPAIPTGKVVTK